jgi:hypothetical protein
MGAGFGLWLTSDPTRTTDTRLLVGVLFLSAFALLLVAWVRWVPLIKR